MEHIRRDDDSSPCLTENPAAPLIPADISLLTPNRRGSHPTWPSPPSSATDSRSAGESPSQPKPLLRGFERPSFSHIVILSVLCLITYPAFYALTFLAKDKSLFVVRLIVSAWCSGIGFALGYILLAIGAQHLEAATWATVMHMSYKGGGGMKLQDLARSSGDPKSFTPAFHLLRSRIKNQETARCSRKSYDKRPWSLFLVFFIFLTVLGPLLPFLLGRIIEIKAFVRNQRKTYREVLIAGDLSNEDVIRAVDEGWFFRPGRTTFDTTELVYDSDTVYFAQPSLSQFVPGGFGAGAFNLSPSASINLKDTPNVSAGRNPPKSNTGVVLRYPQWGIRIHCERLPDPEINLIPLSSNGYTYVFVPRDFLQGLFGMYSQDLPTTFTDPGFGALGPGDTIPSNINLSTISFLARVPVNGEGFSLRSLYGPYPNGDSEWMTIETVLLRFSSDYAPSGRFPVYVNSSVDGRWMGYDAAVCVRKYEPWIIETYNATIVSPSALRVIGKGDDSTPLLPSGDIQGDPIANTRYLNTTGKYHAFAIAHRISIESMTKDNSLDGDYRPYLTAVSFTDGTGPGGYTELSPDRLAITLARVGAANVLPYLAGSKPVVAQLYADETLAYATFKPWQLIGFPIVIWVLGMIGSLFVPALPLDIPRREFGVYSWLALFGFQELKIEASDGPNKLMNLRALEESFSGERVKFVVGEGEG